MGVTIEEAEDLCLRRRSAGRSRAGHEISGCHDDSLRGCKPTPWLPNGEQWSIRLLRCCSATHPHRVPAGRSCTVSRTGASACLSELSRGGPTPCTAVCHVSFATCLGSP